MAKHILDPGSLLQYPMDEDGQEDLGRTHRNYCNPKHLAGQYGVGEWEAQANYGMARDNARQSKFYEAHDRTEDARPDDDRIRYTYEDEGD